MAIFLEGIESIKLACSLVLLIPAVGVALFGRRAPWLVTVWIAVVSLTAWTSFVGWFSLRATGWAHVGVGVAVLALALWAYRRDSLELDVAATAGAAFLASWTWVPCVGRELGDILNNARDEPWVELVPSVLYFVGLFVPLILIAALGVAVPALGERLSTPAVRRVGLGVFALVGGLVVVTLFDDLAGELARRSSF